jgi:hypothetical protein
LIKPEEPQISKDDLQIVHKPRELPTREDIIAFLNLLVPTTEADLNAMSAFLDAAHAITDVSGYKNRIRRRTEPKHCVRCHGTYTNATNTDRSCKVHHVFSPRLEYLEKKASFKKRIYTHLSECCDGVELDTLGDEGEYLNIS